MRAGVLDAAARERRILSALQKKLEAGALLRDNPHMTATMTGKNTEAQ
jgi:hypothetical protein